MARVARMPRSKGVPAGDALLEAARREADTDALTGLGNRRALLRDLDAALLVRPSGGRSLVVALFDLDGMKRYNDRFGHPAGDEILARAGRRLADVLAAAREGSAYRLGGDEFCILAHVPADRALELAARGAEAMCETHGDFVVGCSYGVEVAPTGASVSDILAAADRRLHAQKGARREHDRRGVQAAPIVAADAAA